MANTDLVTAINQQLNVSLPENISAEQLHTELAAYINQLILQNFERLVSLLYRIDVSEAKVKTLLQQNPGDTAGSIIASLIIERQLQKIESRQQFKAGNESEEEKW